MTELSEINQMDYETLVPFFDAMLSTRSELNCAEIASQTNIGYGLVLKYFSRYLVQLQYIKKDEAERCPTCGRLKEEVNSPAICRDIIHYL